MVSPIINFALRGAQALFAVVVLGLSVTLIRGHHLGSFPASLGFAAFVGGISFLAAIIGLAATWFEILGGMVGLVIDGVVALLNVACGIVRTFPLEQLAEGWENQMLTVPKLFAIKLEGVNCNIDLNDLDNIVKLNNNEWFNGGCEPGKNGGTVCYTESSNRNNPQKMLDVYLGHCREASADTVFLFMTAIVMLVCGLMVWLRMKKGY
jgi:hypothetical protein